MAKPGPSLPPYPNQWYMATFSHDLKVGDVKVVEMFDRELVVYRTEDGKAHAVDPYCPHFGAHVGHGGKVVGNTLRCPFHGWQFEGHGGKCVHIPNGDIPPKSARLRTWHVDEHSGMVLVWYHEAGEPPSWHIDPLPEFEGPRWSKWELSDWTLTANIQDISENDADWSHSPIMHSFLEGRPNGEAEIDGALFVWNLTFRARLKAFGIPSHITLPEGLASQVRTHRWGLAIGWITQRMELPGGITFRTQTLATTTPLDPQRVRLQMVHRIAELPVPIPFLNGMLRRTYAKTFSDTVEEDIEIWRHKIYRTKPMVTKSDAGVMKFRRWARQFYSDPDEGGPRRLPVEQPRLH